MLGHANVVPIAIEIHLRQLLHQAEYGKIYS